MKERKKEIWSRCVGFHDACDYCIENGIECKEFVRGSQTESLEEKKSKDAVADGTMDIIDGMKATRSFAACERCLEEKVKCDESLPGCGSCTGKGVECKYKLLSTAFSSELSHLCQTLPLIFVQGFQKEGGRNVEAPCPKSIKRIPRKIILTSRKQGFQMTKHWKRRHRKAEMKASQMKLIR